MRGNLFYRGLVLARPVFVGETLRTRTEIVGLKQNRRRPGAPATGLVAMRIRTTDEHGEPGARLLALPDDPAARPGCRDRARRRLRRHPAGSSTRRRCAPRCRAGWRLDRLRAAVPGPHHAELAPGQAFVVEAGETVTGAPELARLTLNVAMAHTDATGSAHGRRLVYGGHTISIAAAHATRAIPAIATIVAWQGCDHLGPVFEGDVLRTELRVEHTAPRRARAGLRALVGAVRSGGEPAPVLDWTLRGGGGVDARESSTGCASSRARRSSPRRSAG